MKKKHVLFVVTSNGKLGKTERKTGVWFSEFAIPYDLCRKAGCHITVSSPGGEAVPVDPGSLMETPLSAYKEAAEVLKHTVPLSEIRSTPYTAAFYPGGYGPMGDLAYDLHNIHLLEDFFQQKKWIAAVCHGPAALLSAKRQDGKSILFECHVTGFSDEEERLAGFEKLVPFSLEQELKKAGTRYRCLHPWHEYVEQEDHLLTGQNQASARGVAERLLTHLLAE